MSSLVLELQREALDPNVRVSDLLRKALVVARKLKLNDFEEWISAELNGYPERASVPDYREMFGEVKAFNPYNGLWIPVIMDDMGLATRLSRRGNNQSIAEIEELGKHGDGKLQMPFSKELERFLIERIGMPVQPTLIVSASGIVRILDAVRNIVLNWALKLEEDGILGNGISFSAEERSIASHHTYNINHFYGSVSGSQIQQGTTDSSQRG